MRIFYSKPESSWGRKINFVDTNNRFVGYDFESSCCEHFGFYLSRRERNDMPDKGLFGGDIGFQEKMQLTLDDGTPFVIEGYFFDPYYFVEVEIPVREDGYREYFDEGGMVRFKIKKRSSEIYLHLFNCHNGYYGHGFNFGIGKDELGSGGI